MFDIDPATVNADIVYLGLVFSLWFAVTAAYIPGTGIIEGVALVGFGASLVVLTQVSTSWLAVLLIVLGGSLFMIVPFVKQKYAPFALIGLGMQGIGGLLLFTSDLSVSPLVLALSLIIPATYHQLVLMPMLRNARERPIEERDSKLVGMLGRVTHTINPVGTVYVGSEHWSAMADDGESVIEKDVRVRVTGRESLRLLVEPIKNKREEGED
jgi:membrane-bound ClpP family serine protease